MNNEPTGANAQSIDLATLLRDMLKSWWIALLVALMAAMGAYMVVTERYEPQYTATSTLVVSYTESTANVYSDISAANTLAKAFSQVLNSDVMRQKVTDALGTDTFTGTIDAQIVEETNLLTVTVTADEPQVAWKAARALLDNYSTVTSSIMDNVVVSVLKAPAFPTVAGNAMNRLHVMKMAFLIGAVVVFAIAGVSSFLRDTVKNEQEFLQKVDARLLSTVYYERKYKTPIAFLRHRKTSILISNPTTSFGFAETYKVLCTKVEYAAEKKNHKVLMVASVMENEGKSTVAANLALALAQKGHRVILVDGDMRRPAVHKVFDLKAPGKNQLQSLVEGTTPFADMKLCEADCGLRLLASGKSCPDSTDLVSSDGMKRLLDYLREQADFVLLDMPPMSLVVDAECMAQLADASLLVVRQNMSWARDINDAVDMLKEASAEFLGCVFNHVHAASFLKSVAGGSSYGHGYGYGYGYGYGDYSTSRKRTTGNVSSSDAGTDDMSAH